MQIKTSDKANEGRPTTPSLAITIPVLNEEETLVTQIEKILNYLPNLQGLVRDSKIIIADNGSTDGTQNLGEGLAQKYANVRYLRLHERGVGRALKASWSTSDADIVGYMDLDLATDINHLREAISELVESADIVTGSRLLPKSKVIGRKIVRAITSRGFNLCLKAYLGTGFSDGMCGFKFLWRKNLSCLMTGGANQNSWFFATALLVVAEWQKLKIKELPVVWRDDPDSRVKIIPLALQYLKEMYYLKPKRLNDC